MIGSISKKALVAVLVTVLFLPPGFATVVSAAEVSVVAKKFSNCTALNKTYPGGVSKSATVVNKGGKTKVNPSVNAKVYKENKSKDRDGDGIACEN